MKHGVKKYFEFKEIEMTAEMDMQIWGVVTNIITNVNDVRSCMP